MTIAEAIRWLEGHQKMHGPQTLVYFDCPVCKQSFTPGTLATQAVHLKADKDQVDV